MAALVEFERIVSKTILWWRSGHKEIETSDASNKINMPQAVCQKQCILTDRFVIYG